MINNKELEKVRKSGEAVRCALQEMTQAVRPGISTLELNDIGAAVLAKHNSRSSPRQVYYFPADVCISINSEVLHGIPSRSKILQENDLVKLDLVAEYRGWHTDACVTVIVGEGTELDKRLSECAIQAFKEAFAILRAGIFTNEIGTVIQQCANRYGFEPLIGFGGHGIGRTIHSSPFIPNYFLEDCNDKIKEGDLFTIEPIICEKSGEPTPKSEDGWTIKTRDGGRAAHYEHTIWMSTDGPVIIT